MGTPVIHYGCSAGPEHQRDHFALPSFDGRRIADAPVYVGRIRTQKFREP